MYSPEGLSTQMKACTSLIFFKLLLVTKGLTSACKLDELDSEASEFESDVENTCWK